jgi:phage terminase small subunit
MKPPVHLSIDARRHWNRITAAYEITADAAMILETALANWDMAQAARELLRREGMVVDNRRHPAIETQKLGDMIFLRCMRELGLNIAPPGDVGRPPLSLGEDKDVPTTKALLPESKQTFLF